MEEKRNQLFLCDPHKNTKCTKRGCVYIHPQTGVCIATTSEKFAKQDENGKPIKIDLKMRKRVCGQCGYVYDRKIPEIRVYCFRVEGKEHFLRCSNCLRRNGVSISTVSNERWAEAYGYEHLI